MSLAKPATGPEPATTATDTRAAITAALGAIEGLSAAGAAPDGPAAGAAWPVWATATFNGRIGAPAVWTYDVYVVLPAGYLPSTVDKADGLVDQVVAALWPVGVVQ